MINEPSPFTGLNIRMPITIPIKGRKFINQGSGLPFRKMVIILSPSRPRVGHRTVLFWIAVQEFYLSSEAKHIYIYVYGYIVRNGVSLIQ